ncbi:acetylserotonin O-methyltransferase [Actinoallomurus soli]|uniref:acetylserotonin O-methyltransferase n=1 Tax=Actinoallomurus soli TaxID=2952535 RepID=UPI002093F2FF|nr:acetylserotonin O-methyltransferase [Actinoallomurus soli]MCO5973418.1 acetylserotonin O-methyltransferase [Actinoallomurus soli]
MNEQPPPSAVMTQLLAGFQVSQALYVVAKLGICTMLDDGPLSMADLAQRSGASPQPLGRVIRTLGMLGLFRTTEDGRVETTPLGATLSHNHPQTQANVAEMWMEQQYLPFSDLLHTVRTGEPATEHYLGQPPFDWISADPERAALFARAMADVTGTMRTGLFDGYDLPPGKVVADIGGADGSLLAELFTSHPDRHGIVFDKPAVAPIAAETMITRGLADRVEAVAGDFFTEVPAADVYLLSFVLHDWNDDDAVRILQTIRRSAAPDSRLLVVEGVMPADDTPHPMKLVDLTMLGGTAGRERTADEFTDLLTAGGFHLDRIVPRPSPFSIIEATPL